MSYLAAALYVLGMIQTDDLISVCLTDDTRRRFTLGVIRAGRVIIVTLWPMYLICTCIASLMKGRPR